MPPKTPCRSCGASDRDAAGRCRPCRKRRARRYYEAHRERVRERGKRWVAEHPEKARESSRAASERCRRNASPERKAARRAAAKAWREKNKAYITQKAKAWHAANPDAGARYARDRKIRKLTDLGAHTPGEFLTVLAECGGACVYCGAPATTRDHVVPVAVGGSDSVLNIVPSCKPCNSSKGDMPLIVWLAKRATENQKERRNVA